MLGVSVPSVPYRSIAVSSLLDQDVMICPAAPTHTFLPLADPTRRTPWKPEDLRLGFNSTDAFLFCFANLHINPMHLRVSVCVCVFRVVHIALTGCTLLWKG